MSLSDHEYLIEQLIKSNSDLTESNKELGKSVYQVHGVVSSVHTRLEHFIEAHASHVRQQELRDSAHEERADEHSKRLDDTASKVLAWEAQIRLVIGIASLLGGGGLIAIAAAIVNALKQ